MIETYGCSAAHSPLVYLSAPSLRGQLVHQRCRHLRVTALQFEQNRTLIHYKKLCRQTLTYVMQPGLDVGRNHARRHWVLSCYDVINSAIKVCSLYPVQGVFHSADLLMFAKMWLCNISLNAFRCGAFRRQ